MGWVSGFVDIMGRFILWSSPYLFLQLAADLEAMAAGLFPPQRSTEDDDEAVHAPTNVDQARTKAGAAGGLVRCTVSPKTQSWSYEHRDAHGHIGRLPRQLRLLT